MLPEVGHFFRGLGVTVLQGYGLTETTGAATGTPVQDGVMGTVSRPLSGCAVKVSADGEIHLKGDHLFSGYWNAPDATAAVMHDGWFATGDLGVIENGSLRVEGRNFVSALVALDGALLSAWLRAEDLPQMNVEEASVHERVRELIGKVVAAANEQVSKAEAIKEYRIVPRGFSEAREEVTASLKVRRDVVLTHFADVVEAIYAKAKSAK